ncbi:hypothetical protein GQ457_11G023430 [Hibiscus cannabinus]
MTWLCVMASALWSIWLARNDMVFNGKVSTVKDILFYTKLRALMWVKTIQNSVLFNEARWWTNPCSCSLSKGLVHSGFIQAEEPLGHFFVHGTAEGTRASCGGVLIFRGGTIRALFSGLVNGDCRIYAGIVAAREAVNLIITAGWSGKGKFVLVFDSLSLSNWFAFLLLRPWKFFNSLAEFDDLSIKCKKLEYTCVPKEENGMAVHLAIDGLPRLNCFSAWW